MLNGLTVVALIPARGGSKGLPGKNLMKIGGKSLIERAVDCARGASDLIDFVAVSSDDPAILEEAARVGAIAHTRSAEAASDTATAADLIEDFFSNPEALLVKQDVLIVYLQPTSPMRTAAHVRQALDMVHANLDLGLANPSVVSVTPLEKSPYWTLVIEDGKLSPLFPEAFSQNRQTLPATYVPNGALYLFRWLDFEATRKIPTAGSSAFVMSAEESIDIDTKADFDRAVAIAAEQETLGGAGGA